MNKHYQYDVLPHLRDAAENAPSTLDAMIWRSQFIVDHCIHSVFPGGFDDLLPGARKWATDHAKLQRGIAFHLSSILAGKSLEPKKESYFRDCEPFAWIEKAFFLLAIGVDKAAKDPVNPRKIILSSSPEKTWEAMRLVEYQNIISQRGILEGKPPKNGVSPRGKAYKLKEEVCLLDDLTADLKNGIKTTIHVKHGDLPPRGVHGEPVLWEDNPRYYLLLTAHYLSQYDTEFNLDYWNHFQDWAGRRLREMRTSDKYYVSKLLPDGAYAILKRKTKGSREKV